MPVEYQTDDLLDTEGHFLFVGGPRDGEVLKIPKLPHPQFYPPHIEFPIYGSIPKFKFGVSVLEQPHYVVPMRTSVYHLSTVPKTGIFLYVHESEMSGAGGLIRKFMKAYAKENRRESCSTKNE
jgi:hypothetical protein